MNEELEQALADLITKSTEAAGDALAFTQDQLPEVVQQLLRYEFVVSLSVFALSTLAYIFFSYAWVRYSKEEIARDADNFWPAVMIGLVLLAPYVVVVSNMVWLKIWLAPKVYLIEYAANLVK